MSRHTKVIRIVALSCVGLLVVALGTGTWNALRPLPVVAASLDTMPPVATGTPTLAWPTSGEAAVGADGYGVLATNGGETPLPTASVAKIITTLAVLQKDPLATGEQGPTFTVGASDVAVHDQYIARDGSVVPVAIGEQLTEYQALVAMLLPSANNIADSLATWVFGSLSAYHDYATQMLQQMSLSHTTIGTDASGLSPTTLSTPSDLVSLGIRALQNATVASIVSQKSAEIPVAGTVYNVNSLLGQNGIIGIKTGNSDQAGGCLLFATKIASGSGQSVTTVGAIMGVPSLYAALHSGLALSNSVGANFAVARIVNAGQTVGQYRLPWGGDVTAVAAKDLSLVTWKGSAVTSHTSLQSITKALAKGATVGTVTATSNAQTAMASVILEQAAPAPTVWWRATRH